jgi:LuxR family transcriptional regulator, maltose regulon positive regulatory protein
MSALVYAVAARTALHRGDLAASEQLARAARLRPLLTHAIPWLAVQTLLELGGAYLALEDLAGTRAVLRQAGDILQLRPNLGILPAQVEELRSRLDLARQATTGASLLTTAELRLLPLWPPTSPFARSASGCTSPTTRSRPRPSPSTASSGPAHAARRSSGCRRSASSPPST